MSSVRTRSPAPIIMEYIVQKHFGSTGPTMYSSTIDADFLNFLKTISEQTKEQAVNVGQYLWSNNNAALKKQLKIQFTEEQQTVFLQNIKKHVLTYVSTAEQTKLENIDFVLTEHQWVNFQNATEYIDFHTHGGEMSCVIYIDVPRDILQGRDGSIEFLHNNISHIIQPANSTILLFPSDLFHKVYPFKIDRERISMSFNLANFILK